MSTLPATQGSDSVTSSIIDSTPRPIHTLSHHSTASQESELLWQSKVIKLENHLQTIQQENEELERKLRDSVEQRADLEANYNALQMEFETFKSTVQETMTPNQRLQRDMERLAEKLMDEAERRSEIEHSKQLVEAELEDLTKSLFEEANRMVSAERETISHLRTEYASLQLQHNDALALLAQYKEQCSGLKTRLFEATTEQNTILSTESTLTPLPRCGDPVSVSRTASRLRRTGSFSTLATSSGGLNRCSTYDSFRDSGISRYSGETSVSSLPTLSFSPKDYRFLEFQEFLEAPATQGTYLTSKFAKRALNEEVDTTLKFDASTIGFFFNKKLLTAVQQGTINIYQSKDDDTTKLPSTPTNTSSSWRTTLGLSSNSAPRTNLISDPVSPSPTCTLCSGNLEKTSLTYLYTIQSGDTDSKLACGLCRSRLVAATHFFSLLRHIRAGLVKGTPQKLYLAALHAKLQLFLSRAGAIADDVTPSRPFPTEHSGKLPADFLSFPPSQSPEPVSLVGTPSPPPAVSV